MPALHRNIGPARAPATQEGAQGQVPSQPLFLWAITDLGVTARVDNSGGIQASLAGRYATALFELARDENQIETVEASLGALRQALAESEDFRQLTTSPLITRDEGVRAAAATAKAMKLDPITSKFLGVLARNHRLAQLGTSFAPSPCWPPAIAARRVPR